MGLQRTVCWQQRPLIGYRWGEYAVVPDFEGALLSLIIYIPVLVRNALPLCFLEDSNLVRVRKARYASTISWSGP
jgi:hypothetical protein